MKEIALLLAIHLKVKWCNFFEFIKVAVNYYPKLTFLKLDISLLSSYFWRGPFQISKYFLIHKGEKDPHKYGETPLTTLDLIAKECGLSAIDTVFELGCGRGRTCFWLNQFISCTVVGIDYVPAFIEKAEKLRERFHLRKISFRLEDFSRTDLKGASVIYLYGTCLSAAEIDHLTKRFSQLPKGTKIITVSYPLTEFQPRAPFRIVKQFLAPFTWGKATVYLQVKN